MKAEYVELVLLEQSLSYADGLNQSFSNRVSDVSEKTGGSVLFDVRVDSDVSIQRMAAIGYGTDGTVVIVMRKDGHLLSAPVNENDFLIGEMSAWNSLSMADQVRVSYSATVATLLERLRQVGLLGGPT